MMQPEMKHKGPLLGKESEKFETRAQVCEETEVTVTSPWPTRASTHKVTGQVPA